MVKKKEKKTKKKSKEKESKKEPTEREILEKKIRDLEEELAIVDAELSSDFSERDSALNRLLEQREEREACVFHLMRLLRDKNRECEWIGEMANVAKMEGEEECVEEMRNIEEAEVRIEVERRAMIEEKEQLEESLSQLEDVRLTKEKQEARMKKALDELGQHVPIFHQVCRQFDAAEVEKLILDRQNLKETMQNEKKVWNELLQDTVYNYTKLSLEKQLNLRESCRQVSRRLIVAQNRQRRLDDLLMPFNQEEEGLRLAEQNIEKLQQSSEGVSKEDKMQQISKSSEEYLLEQAMTHQDRDINQEIGDIMKDQEAHKIRVQSRLNELYNAKGVLISTIIRTKRVLRDRYARRECVDDSIDSGLLLQMRKILG